MTTINDISDFARIIREQPEWADTIRSLLLSRELLELPIRFAEFVELTNRNFQLVYERQERLETGIANLESRVSNIETDIADVKSRVSNIETGIAKLESRVSNIETGMSGLRTDFNFVRGRLDNAVGAYYEWKVIRGIGGAVGSSFRRVRVLKGLLTGPDREFMDLVEDAEDNGVITDEQYLQVQELDVVLIGRRKADGTQTYIAGEISITIGDSDITRAAERAAILSRVIGQPVEPVVIGSNVDDARTALAATNGVAVFLVSDD